jgi:predicted AlkP superfamily pyrophosphatase or phosphodiesterase
MTYRSTILAALILLGLSAISFAQTTRPIPQVDHVLIISIDGLRPDVLLRADAPNIKRLYQNGSFTFWAQTVPVAITLPSHTSMLTGVPVETHHITFNDERATTRPIYPNAKTIFEVAKEAGYTTAMVTGKSKFMALAKPNTIDWISAPEDPKTTDATVGENARAMIRDHKPQLMFLHFPGVDTTGHAKGWASPEQFTALEAIDAQLRTIFDTMAEAGLSDSTVIILSADHGGSGRSHGAGDVRSLNIPWIAYGPGIRKNFDLTSLRTTINTTDTFATACYLLGIPLPPDIQGKPQFPIVEGYQLLRNTPPTASKRPAQAD